MTEEYLMTEEYMGISLQKDKTRAQRRKNCFAKRHQLKERRGPKRLRHVKAGVGKTYKRWANKKVRTLNKEFLSSQTVVCEVDYVLHEDFSYSYTESSREPVRHFKKAFALSCLIS